MERSSSPPNGQGNHRPLFPCYSAGIRLPNALKSRPNLPISTIRASLAGSTSALRRSSQTSNSNEKVQRVAFLVLVPRGNLCQLVLQSPCCWLDATLAWCRLSPRSPASLLPLLVYRTIRGLKASKIGGSVIRTGRSVILASSEAS